MLQLGWVEEVVFDGIAWTIHDEVSETRHATQCFDLHIHWQRRTESIQIHLVRRLPLRLEEEHVLVAVGEGVELGFDAWAVARTYTLNLSIEERGVGKACSQHLVHLGSGVANPARQLLQFARHVHVGEAVVVRVAILLLHQREIHAALVDPHRGARLHASAADAMLRDGFREQWRSRFCDASSREFVAPDVHQSVEEGASGNHHAFRSEFCTKESFNSLNFSVFNDDFLYLVLPNVEIFRVFEDASPSPDEFLSIALCSWTPHGWSLRAVQHSELQSAAVGHDSHLSAQCVNLAHNLTFCNSAHGRIATHLRNLVHVHRDEASLCAHPCCCRSRLTSSMSCSHYENVVFKNHYNIYFTLQTYTFFLT